MNPQPSTFCSLWWLDLEPWAFWALWASWKLGHSDFLKCCHCWFCSFCALPFVHSILHHSVFQTRSFRCLVCLTLDSVHCELFEHIDHLVFGAFVVFGLFELIEVLAWPFCSFTHLTTVTVFGRHPRSLHPTTAPNKFAWGRPAIHLRISVSVSVSASVSRPRPRCPLLAVVVGKNSMLAKHPLQCDNEARAQKSSGTTCPFEPQKSTAIQRVHFCNFNPIQVMSEEMHPNYDLTLSPSPPQGARLQYWRPFENLISILASQSSTPYLTIWYSRIDIRLSSSKKPRIRMHSPWSVQGTSTTNNFK